MNVRAVFRAIEVSEIKPPFNSISAKVYYPALEPQNDTERNSGIISSDQSGAPYPVVIFLNGVNCPPESYQWLAEYLCNRGCVFVTFNWITNELPGGLQGLTPGIDMRYMRAEDSGKGPTGSAVAPILADLEALNADGLLAGILDLDNVILAGHSAGGSIALTNAHYFPQIKAVFSYGSHTQGSTMLGFTPGTILPVSPHVPALMMGGDNDGVITWSSRRYGKTDESSINSVEQTFEHGISGDTGNRFLAIFRGANHFTFAHPKDQTTGRPFLDSPAAENEAEIRALMAGMIFDLIAGYVKGSDEAKIRLEQIESPSLAMFKVK
jgi:pimeloyl-ACP methyl ester carboxylesterase